MLANVTDLGVLIKVGTSSGLVWVTSLATFGGFAFDLPLGLEAATGDYYVSATLADQVFRMTFTVQEFRAASFEVALKSQQAAPKPGARLTFDLDASYLGRHGAGDRNRPQCKMGLVELKVSAAQKELAVGITLERATVRPGEPVVGTIRVLSNGQPVKAEVSLSAADDPDEGGDSESTLAGQRVRSKFVSSAYWAPMLVTDAHGEIRFRFTAPDNLTALRLMAVAADAGDRFGAGEFRLTLAALLEADPKSALVDPLAAGLKSQRLASGSWQSTQENLWSLVALSAYARRSAGGTTTLAVTVGGKTTKRTITGTQVATQTFAVGDAGVGAIGISVDSPANITARVKESRVDAGAAVANGFAIERRYVNAAGVEPAAFAASDVVTVKLTVVVGAAQKWVALVDPLPAGLEVMNSKLAAGGVRTKATPGADAGADGDGGAYEYWRGLQWVHQDVRDDRVEWFADSIEAGTYEMNYQARATIDGTFATMPATIEAVYEPTIRGRTARGTLVVTK